MTDQLLTTIYNSLKIVGAEMVCTVDLDDKQVAYLSDLGIDVATEHEDFKGAVLTKNREAKNFFTPEELVCKCCGKGGLVSKVHKALNTARALAGVPFVITSAYRCKKHNAAVGGSDTSSHTARYAVDIACANSPNRFKIIGGLLAAGFNRIGIAKDFIHADMDPKKSPEVIWLY